MTTKDVAAWRIRDCASQLLELSHRIHATPEVGFQEFQSSRAVGDALAGHRFDVIPGVCDLPTPFDARFGSGRLHVGLCAEYDSLPGIGHAWGTTSLPRRRSAPRSAWRRWPETWTCRSACSARRPRKSATPAARC